MTVTPTIDEVLADFPHREKHRPMSRLVLFVLISLLFHFALVKVFPNLPDMPHGGIIQALPEPLRIISLVPAIMEKKPLYELANGAPPALPLQPLATARPDNLLQDSPGPMAIPEPHKAPDSSLSRETTRSAKVLSSKSTHQHKLYVTDKPRPSANNLLQQTQDLLEQQQSAMVDPETMFAPDMRKQLARAQQEKALHQRFNNDTKVDSEIIGRYDDYVVERVGDKCWHIPTGIGADDLADNRVIMLDVNCTRQLAAKAFDLNAKTGSHEDLKLQSR